MEVIPFSPDYTEQVLSMIVNIQQREFHLPITAEDQPDLARIPEFYQKGNGNFWIALKEGGVVGTISLLDIADKRAALRKMFVHPEYRGDKFGTARSLLDECLNWSKKKGLSEIFLGTTPKFKAAHRFYEKNGFTEISREELPAAFPIMKVDTKFYTLKFPPPIAHGEIRPAVLRMTNPDRP